MTMFDHDASIKQKIFVLCKQQAVCAPYNSWEEKNAVI